MPIYEYQCDDCRHCFEKLLFAADGEQKADCPSCGSEKTRKLISCASFIGGSAGGLCTPGAPGGFS
jgi:putative FmdB family regulatory protein